jgi:O-antigen/teichoic acid export membrane protein
MRSQRRDSRGMSIRHAGSEAKGLFGFGLKVVPVQLLAMANARLDVLVLGALAGTAAVGIYSVAVSATLLVGMVPAALGQALTKSFGSDANAVRQLRAGIQVALVSGLVVGAGIAALSPWMVPLVFGRAFGPSVLLIAIMVPFTAVFSTVQVSYPFFYNHLHRPGIHSLVIGATAAIDLGLLAVLVPAMGAVGAALASAIAYAIGAALNIVITSRATGLGLWDLMVPSRDDLKWMLDSAKALMVLPGRM